MFQIIDKRNHRPDGLSLHDLGPNETFEWGYGSEAEAGLDRSAPHRMLHQNSNYLGTSNRHCRRMYVLNMFTGKIHHRDQNTPVRRIDVQMCIFDHGDLKR